MCEPILDCSSGCMPVLSVFLCLSSFSSFWKTWLLPAQYLFFTLILCYQVEWDGVERAGHDAKYGAEDECGDDVGEEANQAGAHTEHKVPHEV